MESSTYEVVLWLVKNHDVLGNMFTGERAPRCLTNETRRLSKRNAEHRLSLLQIVTLCDVWATAGGKFLTEQKARHWLTLGDRKSLEDGQDRLYDWRLRRWTGDLAGVDDLEAAAYVKQRLKKESARLRLSARDVFRDRIDHVIYGFYLFATLSTEELARLLVLLTQEYNKRVPSDDCSVTLAFEKYKPWEPDTDWVLQAYRNQIGSGKLDCEYDSARRTLRVKATAPAPHAE